MAYYNTKLGDNVSYGDVCYKYKNRFGVEKVKFRYRCGPVANTGKWRKYGRYLCSPHTFNEMKLNSDPEYFVYTRPARRNLPTLYDDIPLNFYRGWKHCTKKRKQWM